MSALEQEIYEKFQQLDENAKQRVLEQLRTQTKAFDFDAWLFHVQAVQKTIRQEQGEDYRIDAVELLREVREDKG